MNRHCANPRVPSESWRDACRDESCGPAEGGLDRQVLKAEVGREFRTVHLGNAALVQADCLDWLRLRESNSIHAVVTDPPYGLIEYSPKEQKKLRAGKGGVWRLPPAFDGAQRSPLPRFTVLSPHDLRVLDEFFSLWARRLARVLVPGHGFPPDPRRLIGAGSNSSVYSTSTSRPIRASAVHRAVSRGAVQASSRYSDIWMFSQLPRRSMDSTRADRRLPASIRRAGISLRRRGT